MIGRIQEHLEAIYGLPMQVLSHPQGQQPIAVVV